MSRLDLEQAEPIKAPNKSYYFAHPSIFPYWPPKTFTFLSSGFLCNLGNTEGKPLDETPPRRSRKLNGMRSACLIPGIKCGRPDIPRQIHLP